MSCLIFFLKIRRPPRSTRTDTLFPYTTLFRSCVSHPADPLSYRSQSLVTFPDGKHVPGSDHNPRRRSASAAAPVRYRLPGIQRALCGIRNRSEEHTSELQSLMRISYAVFCLKKKHIQIYNNQYTINILHT